METTNGALSASVLFLLEYGMWGLWGLVLLAVIVWVRGEIATSRLRRQRAAQDAAAPPPQRPGGSGPS